MHLLLLSSSGLKALRTAALSAVVVLALVKQALKNRSPTGLSAWRKGKPHTNGAATNGERPAEPAGPRHNVQRQAAIARGGPTDHAGSVVIVPNDAFDLNQTIFKSLNARAVRFIAKAKLGNHVFWSEPASNAIQAAYSTIPATPSIKKPILNFMEEDCDFAMEHADGSFMDHLNFCHDYSAVHYSEHSPMVLFLHSIMGVGTNYFPMSMDKVPKLKSMLTDFEYKHIEAFPSVVRLLNARSFIQELSMNRGRLDKLESVSFFRVMDNAPLTLTGEDLWIQLNYQVVHLLDFLPAACWSTWLSEPLFQTFVELIIFMQETGKLKAHIEFERPSGETTVQGQALTLGASIFRLLPCKFTRKAQIKEIKRYSAAIGHSLEYKIQWAA